MMLLIRLGTLARIVGGAALIMLLLMAIIFGTIYGGVT